MSFVGNKSNIAACFFFGGGGGGGGGASADFEKKTFCEKIFQDHHHTRETCTRTVVVITCWLQSMRAQNCVPSC